MKLFSKKTNEQVELPQGLVDFRGKEQLVTKVAEDASPGRSGKVLTAEGRTLYPGVFDCYIADEPLQ